MSTQNNSEQYILTVRDLVFKARKYIEDSTLNAIDSQKITSLLMKIHDHPMNDFKMGKKTRELKEKFERLIVSNESLEREKTVFIDAFIKKRYLMVIDNSDLRGFKNVDYHISEEKDIITDYVIERLNIEPTLVEELETNSKTSIIYFHDDIRGVDQPHFNRNTVYNVIYKTNNEGEVEIELQRLIERNWSGFSKAF